MQEDAIPEFVESLGKAISAGDQKKVSECFGVPALFLSDDGAMVFSRLDEIERVFAQASEEYHSRGIVSTKPQIELIEMLSEKLAALDVRWPSLDASGKEKASERSHYIVHIGKDRPHIQVALTRTK